jgi:uracil-DNA glycosylase
VGDLFIRNFCKKCPFHNQKNLNLGESQIKTPVLMERGKNESKSLIVFKYPGIHESVNGKIMVNIFKRGGNIADRIFNSWKRVDKSKEDYDITFFIKCYKGENVKNVPKKVVEFCSKIFRKELLLKEYDKIFIFGKEFYIDIIKIIEEENLNHLNIVYKDNILAIQKEELDGIW